MDERYLGDGVYISDDGYQLRLRCAAPSEPDVIFLDHQVLTNLLGYAMERGFIGKAQPQPQSREVEK